MKIATITSWFFPILSALVVTAVSVGLIFPWVKDLSNKRKEINERKTQVNEVLQPKLKLLQNLDKEILRTQLSELELLLPSNIQTPYIFATIERLTGENEVSVKGLSYAGVEKGKSKEESLLETLNFNFIISGEVDSLVKFVNSLEKATPLFSINTYSQTKNEAEPDSVSLAISSFYKTLPEKVGGVKESLKEWSKDEKETLRKLEELNVYAPAVTEKPEAQSIPLGKSNPF